MKHPGGRPTDYDDDFDYVGEAENYIKNCGREQTKLPKLEEFYDIVDINADTGVEWCKKHPKFSEACKKITAAQKQQLMDDGLYGGREVNPGMAIFLLKVNHGLVETEKHVMEGTMQHVVRLPPKKELGGLIEEN